MCRVLRSCRMESTTCSREAALRAAEAELKPFNGRDGCRLQQSKWEGRCKGGPCVCRAAHLLLDADPALLSSGCGAAGPLPRQQRAGRRGQAVKAASLQHPQGAPVQASPRKGGDFQCE